MGNHAILGIDVTQHAIGSWGGCIANDFCMYIYIYILLIIYTGEVYMLHLYIHIVVHRVNDGVEHR